ncbi:GIY-YIG nuclease family protein [Natrinema ejinorense]|nr:GIY-YIG nuclease family protein [Natrinema ejinorense]
MPYRDPHTAAPCLWAVHDRYGPEFEVSYAVPSEAKDKQERKAIEAALIAVARREMGESPTANFGRIIDGYKQSSYSKDEIVGGPLSEDETESNTENGRGPVPWENVNEVTGSNWMGLEWSEPYFLKNRLAVDPPDNGLYRIWYGSNSPPLAYIGESSNISSRLYNHEKTFGGDALFSYVNRPELDAAHKRQEIETDLIGVHYLENGEAPIAQFGYEEQLQEI